MSWKGMSTNSIVPVFSRPNLSASGPAFKARPIKHWRKQLIPENNSGSRRAGLGMPMDTPGGSVYLGNVASNTDCLLNFSNTSDAVVGIKEDIVKYNNTDFTFTSGDKFYDSANNRMVCTACNPVANRLRPATTILNKNYYTDRKSYMRSRCILYEQKQTTIPVPTITYLDANQNILNPTDSTTGSQVRQTQNCKKNCTTPTACQTIYKPNNTQYAQQGAVDSSSRLTRLKLNTINKTAAVEKIVFGSASSRYLGSDETPYNLKAKYQSPVTFSYPPRT
jgi:hypothetical protein